MKIHPSEIKIGDVIAQHGAFIKVQEISVHEEKDCLPVYVMSGGFSGGNREMFDYFRGFISSGIKCGSRCKYSSVQGNELAYWEQVEQSGHESKYTLTKNDVTVQLDSLEDAADCFFQSQFGFKIQVNH